MKRFCNPAQAGFAALNFLLEVRDGTKLALATDPVVRASSFR